MVNRIHMVDYCQDLINEFEKSTVICNNPNWTDMTDNWRLVTCKKCLEKREEF